MELPRVPRIQMIQFCSLQTPMMRLRPPVLEAVEAVEAKQLLSARPVGCFQLLLPSLLAG